MIRAFFFLLSCSVKNRVLLRLKRLRQPKYLISALAGLAYLYFIFFHRYAGSPQIPRETPAFDENLNAMVEMCFAFCLLVIVAFQWLFRNSRTPLFSEPEVQFLFPAPISRSALIHYRLAKAQIGILFGTLLSFIIFGRGISASRAWFLLVTLWLVYSFLSFYKIAILLGTQTRRLWAATLVFFLCAIILVASWIRFVLPPAGPDQQSLFAWLAKLAESGPVFYLLFPFRLLIHPAFAPGLPQFSARLAPALAILAAVYGWIRYSGSSVEEAVLGRTGNESIRSLMAAETGGDTPRKIGGRSRRPPFNLAPKGFPPAAIYWKNLSLAGAFDARRTLPALAALMILAILITGGSGEGIPMVVGSIAAALAGFLTILGPIVFREDLRTDLKNVDVLKTYPMPGWGIVLGEILGPVTILAVLQWILIVLAAAIMPSVEATPWKPHERICVGLGAFLLLPCLSFIGVLIQNATVLILPGWVQLGKEHQQGIEAMGQRLISSVATVLFLLVAAVPAALLFLAVFFAGHWAMGFAIIPFASLLASFALLVEAAIGIFWLGRLFDRFDAASLSL
jgi:ABC-2 type transport system permease protein